MTTYRIQNKTNTIYINLSVELQNPIFKCKQKNVINSLKNELLQWLNEFKKITNMEFMEL